MNGKNEIATNAAVSLSLSTVCILSFFPFPFQSLDQFASLLWVICSSSYCYFSANELLFLSSLLRMQQGRATEAKMAFLELFNAVVIACNLSLSSVPIVKY